MNDSPVNETIQNIIDAKFKDRNWLNIQDLAAVFECDPHSIMAWIKTASKNEEGRRPPKFKLGQEYRFPKKEFLAWLATYQKE